MDINNIGRTIYTKIFGNESGEKAKAAPPPQTSEQLPEDISTITSGFAQDKGVIDSSKEVRKGGGSKKNKGGEVLQKEVRLKSGVTIAEDTKAHTVVISRNDGNGNPQTMAVFDDATLTLPSSSEYGTPFAIENKKMKETVTNDGRVEIEDKTHGDYEEKWIMYSGWKEWKSDRYVVTPDGKVSGAQYNPNPDPFGRVGSFVDYSWRNIKFVDGKEQDNGVITAQRNSEQVTLKPFLTRKDVISQ